VRQRLADEFQQPVEDGVPGAGVQVGGGGDALVVGEQTALGQFGERAGTHQVMDPGGVGGGPRGVPGQQAEPGRQ
jgi:hypothetical protein